jgi:hypothetical protein
MTTSKSKIGWGIALVLLMAPIGFLVGGLLSSFAVQQTGLAAAGVAFGYMVIGAAIAVILGIVLAFALPRERLKPLVGVAAVGTLLAVSFIAFRIWQKQQEDAARRAEEAAAVRPPVPPALPDADSLSAPPPLVTDQPVADPPSSEAWQYATYLPVGLPVNPDATLVPDVAFYYEDKPGRLPLNRDAHYYYGLMPMAQSTQPCGGQRVPAMFGETARLDLGTLSPEAIAATAQAECETALTAHGTGYARNVTLRNYEVLVDMQAEKICQGDDPSYVLWTDPDASPSGPLLLTTLPHPDGPNNFAAAADLRLEVWPSTLPKGRFRLPEGSKVSAYAAYRYPGEVPDAYLVNITGTTPGGDEHPPVEVLYQAWFFVLGDTITPLVDNHPGSGCGPAEIDLQGVLDLTDDGDGDLVFGPSLLVLERSRSGFLTRAAPQLPCRC